VFKALADPSLSTWKDFDTYSETLLHIALNVPVEYYPEWVPRRVHIPVIQDVERETANLDFHVKYDGTPLCKPIVLRPPQGKKALIWPFSYKGKTVSAHGYFYAQHGGIRPV
jgi:hypothetical protein